MVCYRQVPSQCRSLPNLENSRKWFRIEIIMVHYIYIRIPIRPKHIAITPSAHHWNEAYDNAHSVVGIVVFIFEFKCENPGAGFGGRPRLRRPHIYNNIGIKKSLVLQVSVRRVHLKRINIAGTARA